MSRSAALLVGGAVCFGAWVYAAAAASVSASAPVPASVPASAAACPY
jgi:hypothetical protein